MSDLQDRPSPRMEHAQAVELMSAPGMGFETVQVIAGSTYKDNSTCIVIPSRGMVPVRVVQAWQNLIAPMNQKRGVLFAVGHEVGHAYNSTIRAILDHPDLSKFKYVLTLEDDNLPPPAAHIQLLETIEWGQFDAVSGIYFTKGPLSMPMAFGDPAAYAAGGELEFRPRDVRAALAAGHVMEVNGIAMGCALWRMDLFRDIPAPWFVTVEDPKPENGYLACMTQDLYFCRHAKMRGKRFAVDLRVKVGHLDINTDRVF